MSDVKIQPGQLRDMGIKDYAIRFLFGGIVTAAVGMVDEAFGPVVAGLFLAFPAILPASLTLVSKHSSKDSASLEAGGAVAGSTGLAAFGAVIWWLATILPAWVVLLAASAAWLAVSLTCWAAIRAFRRHRDSREGTTASRPPRQRSSA